MDDITPKEANEILSHYTDLGYGIVIEGEDTSKIVQALSLARKKLVNGTPYNPTGDAISREDLRKQVVNARSWYTPICSGGTEYGEGAIGVADEIIELIDNAPSVEPDIEFAKWVTNMIFDSGVEDYDFEMFSELACRKLEKMGLVEKTENEWIKKGDVG